MAPLDVSTLRESIKGLDDSLQLESIAFEFEVKALEATGGMFSEARVVNGKKIYTFTITRLFEDYLDGDLDTRDKANLEAFLIRVSPEWSGTIRELVKRLYASVKAYKTSPKINSQCIEELENGVNDLASFKIMTKYLKSVGIIQSSTHHLSRHI